MAPPEDRPDPAPSELIIHFREGSPAEQAVGSARRLRRGVGVVRVDGDDGIGRGGADHAERWRRLRQHMERWRARDGVRLVEPNYYGRFETVPDAAPPDDPEFANQWWLEAVGARGLWPIGQGRGIRVALIDSGVSLAHPDLAANLDGDGYDFGDGDAVPDDGLGHGTEVAGVLAAVAGNGVGIAGLAPAVRVLPIKVNKGNTGTPTVSAVAEAVDYAVLKGARVINLSLVFNPDQTTELLRDRIQNALDRGIAVVAAAGNGAGEVAFPANIPGVIAVAGTDPDGSLHSASNRGPEVAIAAPGATILTTKLGGGYGTVNGTSLAAPMVSGAIAALMSIDGSLPVATLVSLLQATATPLTGPSADQRFGQLQAARAAAGLLPAMTLPAASWTPVQSFEASYLLPPFGAPTDLYVAVTTPAGEYVLLPDCTWTGVSTAGYQPFARGYSNAEPNSGVLFGQGGVCAPISLEGLPAGAYTWRVAATRDGGLIGAINSEAMEIAP